MLYNRSPQWYTAVVLNHVLMKTLPTVDGLRGVMIKLIPFLEASTKSNRLVNAVKYHFCPADILNICTCVCSLELLSLTSGLVPALLLYGNHSQLAEAVLSVLQQKLSSLSLSELATAPAQVICMLVISYMYVYLLYCGNIGEVLVNITCVPMTLRIRITKFIFHHYKTRAVFQIQWSPQYLPYMYK